MRSATFSSSRLLALLICMVLLSPLAIDIYLPAFPMMAESFHVGATQIQDTITWFLFSLGFGQLFAGPMADRFGRRPVALTGIALYSASATLAWLAEQYEWMLVARILQGLGACAASVCAFAAVRDRFGAERSGQMISYLNGAICFIPALAPIFGTWLTLQFGWRSNFSFMLAYALVVWVLIWRLLPETRPQETDVSGSLFSIGRYFSVIKEPVFLYHASLCMLSMASILAYVTSAPVLLMDELGLSMGMFTFWFGLNAVVNIVCCMLAPRYMDKFGSRPALAVGLTCIVAAGALAVALSGMTAAWAFMVPVFISSVGVAFTMGSAAGRALAPFGDRAGTAAALLGMIQMSGAGLLVSLTQRIGLSPSHLIAFHMLLLLPGLIILFSRWGRVWHAHKTAA